MSNRAIFALYLAIFVAVLGFSLVSPIIPVYVIDLGASYILLGIIISAYGAVQLVAQIPAGMLSDRYGRRPLILIGLLAFAVLAPLYVTVKNAYFLIILRGLSGLASSCVWPLAMAFIIDNVGISERGRAMGWYNASFYFALAIGPAIGGFLYDLLGLEAPFYFWSALLLLSFVIVLTQVRDPAKKSENHEKEKSDCQDNRYPLKDPVETKSVYREKKEDLILDGYLLTFIACCAAVMWTGLMMGFNMTLLPNYADNLGFSKTEIGVLYLAFAGTTAISNVHFGKVSDRGRRRLLICGGCAAGTASFLMLAMVSGTLQFLAVMSMLGFASGMCNPASSATIADITVSSRRGEIFGVFNTARMAGAVAGSLVAGVAAEAYGIPGSIFIFAAIAFFITWSTIFVREPPKPKAI